MVKVAIISGSRADYSLLYPVIKAFNADTEVELALIATGCQSDNTQSLSDIFAQDGLCEFANVPSGVVDGSHLSVCNAISTTITGFSRLFSSYQPDIILVLGDRFEIFAAVQAAWIYGIPVAHIAAGDVTEGAIDEAFRHCISKMARLHFTTNADARLRVLQLGEAKETVHLVGSPGIDNLIHCDKLNKTELSALLKINLSHQVYLVTLHPETLTALAPDQQATLLIAALSQLDNEVTLVISAANTDPGGEQINFALRQYAASRKNSVFIENLGRTAYVSLLAIADLMIGNSSSGIYEAASFGLAVVNIGNRQAGRLSPANVLNCEFDTEAILDTIRQAVLLDCGKFENPFGDGHAAERIHDLTIEYIKSSPSLTRRKTFHSYILGDVK